MIISLIYRHYIRWVTHLTPLTHARHWWWLFTQEDSVEGCWCRTPSEDNEALVPWWCVFRGRLIWRGSLLLHFWGWHKVCFLVDWYWQWEVWYVLIWLSGCTKLSKAFRYAFISKWFPLLYVDCHFLELCIVSTKEEMWSKRKLTCMKCSDMKAGQQKRLEHGVDNHKGCFIIFHIVGSNSRQCKHVTKHETLILHKDVRSNKACCQFRYMCLNTPPLKHRCHRKWKLRSVLACRLSTEH